MKCCLCRNGETQPGFVTVTLEREGCTLLVKEVPAEICENCGEYYTSEETSSALLARAEKARNDNTILQVIHFAA
jgi:YgiT-type zinc finger domain-containing protein